MSSPLLHTTIRAALDEALGRPYSILYHASRTPPDVMLQVFAAGEFRLNPNVSHGAGIYCTAEENPSVATFTGGYGHHVYRLAVRIDRGFLIFNADLARAMLGRRDWSLIDQLASMPGLVGRDRRRLIAAAERMDEITPLKDPSPALLQTGLREAGCRGIVYRMSGHGIVVVVFDVASIVPLGWRKLNEPVGAWHDNAEALRLGRESGAFGRLSGSHGRRRGDAGDGDDRFWRAAAEARRLMLARSPDDDDVNDTYTRILAAMQSVRQSSVDMSRSHATWSQPASKDEKQLERVALEAELEHWVSEAVHNPLWRKS